MFRDLLSAAVEAACWGAAFIGFALALFALP
jgi:hypothetical protein